MSTATGPQLDLRELAIDRPGRASAPAPRTKRTPFVTRYLVPGGILLGFLALLAAAVSDQLIPRQEVSVVPVVVRRAEVQQAGTPLFQAAGWVEPRPTPINVTALTEGVVEELLVVEGQPVQAGEPVSRLIQIDAKLALRQAENALKLRQAEQESVQAELTAAEMRVKYPVHLQAALADAQAALAQTETKLAKLPHSIEAAEARVQYTQQNYEGKQAAKDAIAGRLVQQALSEHLDAKSQLTELQKRRPYLENEVKTLQDKVTALNSQLELLIEESRQLKDARARLKMAENQVADAELTVEKVQLALERTVVKAPTSGRVLTLVAAPGSRVMGLDSNSVHNSSTVVTMYDPARLQVRADVRLEDVPLVQPGQPVEIETASSQTPIRGRVLLPTSTANIQKNTLEVKVEVIDPPPAIRPEMLVTATFLAPPTPEADQKESESQQCLLIPRDLVINSEGATAVWLATAEGTAVPQPVTLGKAGTERLVEVLTGVDPTTKLIANSPDGLESGEAVTVTGESTSSQ